MELIYILGGMVIGAGIFLVGFYLGVVKAGQMYGIFKDINNIRDKYQVRYNNYDDMVSSSRQLQGRQGIEKELKIGVMPKEYKELIDKYSKEHF